jgi:glycosyltransferase involved in cell wall biosynthesis
MVSVIIPNYNHSKYLVKRIDSVLNQTYQNFELIILDDCSTDNSRDIIDLYKKHPKVSQVLFNDVNSGSVFKQWEKGIKLAKGEYIWIAESDDYAHPKFLESLMPLIEEDMSLGLVYCNTQIVNQKNIVCTDTYAEIRNRMLSTNKWSNSYHTLGTKEIEENLLQYCTINNASAVIFNKEALINIDPFDKEFKFVGDWYCYLKLCNKYSLKYLNEPLNFYRTHPINASKGLEKDFQFVIEHFYLFDWVFRNILNVSTKIKSEAFYVYTKHRSLNRWSFNKLKVYLKLYKINPHLFYIMVVKNLRRGKIKYF